MKLCLLRVLKEIARSARAEPDDEAARSAAQRASETASAIVKYDAENAEALAALVDLYHEFGVTSR